MLALYVPVIADYLSGPTVDELTGESAVDLTCQITGDGLVPDTAENNVEDPRLCSKQIFEGRGDFTDSLEITYVFNPGSESDDVARLTLTPGTRGYVVLRWALAYETAIAAGQEVDVYPIEAGVQRKQQPTRNGVHRIAQKLFVIGEVARDVAVAAGV